MSSNSDSTPTYSLTSKLQRIIANNPSVTTLSYTNNLELDTVEQGNSPGFGTSVFLVNLSSQTLDSMATLADSALAVGGQATIQYQVVQAGSFPVAVISSLSYQGHTVNAG